MRYMCDAACCEYMHGHLGSVEGVGAPCLLLDARAPAPALALASMEPCAILILTGYYFAASTTKTYPSPRLTKFIIDRGRQHAILRHSFITPSNHIHQRCPTIFTYVPPGPYTRSKPPLPAHKYPLPHPSLN